eukprot:TRINITY_DN15935_c0_g1_i1.p1 TRINITY_DN15935_c0_g1~~TRINITY_DN15935_c0_g1_i1.p1  ORF type:complete len:189 (-),score=40.91 TRINITY_DN15935_c0_g1_i1:78-644(-)
MKGMWNFRIYSKKDVLVVESKKDKKEKKEKKEKKHKKEEKEEKGEKGGYEKLAVLRQKYREQFAERLTELYDTAEEEGIPLPKFSETSLFDIHGPSDSDEYPNTKQTKSCYSALMKYEGCLAGHLEDNTFCDSYRQAANSMCPSIWLDRWATASQNQKIPFVGLSRYNLEDAVQLPPSVQNVWDEFYA